MKPCLECSNPVPTNRHTYCGPCGIKVQRAAAQSHGARRLKGCIKCGGENSGRGSRYCVSCRESMRPTWQRAEAERAKRRNETVKVANAAAGKGRRQVIVDDTKWCNRCEAYKPFSDFGTMRSRKDGLAIYCLVCANDYGHERRLETVYGITRDDYDRMLAEQDGRCAICQNKPRKRRLAVDHDHATGEVRGLLCTRCNQKLLGSANENPAILRRAADYLDAGGAETPWAVLGGWLGELDAEIRNANADTGFVAIRPKNKPHPSQWYAALPLPVLMRLMLDAGWIAKGADGEVAA